MVEDTGSRPAHPSFIVKLGEFMYSFLFLRLLRPTARGQGHAVKGIVTFKTKAVPLPRR